MIVQTIKVNDCTPQTIVIGRRGTYDTLQIAFDLSYLVESYGNGVAVLAVKRSQDESAYPAVTAQEDDLLLWTVSETDTFYVGAGEAQLMWYVDGGLAKTIIYPMVVMKDILMTSEEAPDAYQTWVDDLTALGAETLENARHAAESEAAAWQSKADAEAAARRAEESERNAGESEESAERNAILAESWAVGGTGTRPGEDNNNAKHYAMIAQQGAEESGFAWFDVNDQDGEMYVTITPNLAEDVSFSVNESNGILEVVVNGG